MVLPSHVCPWGLKARWLLRRKGFSVDDRPLRSREETDAYMERAGVETTPQVVIDGERIGGYDDLRRYFGLKVRGGDEASYEPVIAVFCVAALMAVAATLAARIPLVSLHTLAWFIAFSMCILALLKLQDLESFSTMFLNYDLLARRVVRYAYVYPFAELGAGVSMIAGRATAIAAPVALFIGTIGAVSVFKAVYLDKRELKCACVGGGSRVPLGFVSLTENLMMVTMAIGMTWRHGWTL